MARSAIAEQPRWLQGKNGVPSTTFWTVTDPSFRTITYNFTVPLDSFFCASAGYSGWTFFTSFAGTIEPVFAFWNGKYSTGAVPAEFSFNEKEIRDVHHFSALWCSWRSPICAAPAFSTTNSPSISSAGSFAIWSSSEKAMWTALTAHSVNTGLEQRYRRSIPCRLKGLSSEKWQTATDSTRVLRLPGFAIFV